MIGDEIRQQLQNIIGGVILEGQIDNCTQIRNLLIKSFGTSKTVKSEFESKAIVKEKQESFLRSHAEKIGLLVTSLPKGSEYLTRGGEAEIYLAPQRINVVKINDAIYYATWTEYFNSLVIHNLMFPNTNYTLLGFIDHKGKFSVVLEQPFVEGQQARLEDINELLTFNGFLNTKRQDYYNDEFGLILEDMHDENVIVKENILFFIDTVFYLIEK